MPLEERSGFDIYSRTLGNGPRRALMLHCSLAHSGAWRGLVGALDDVLCATACDFLSHGRSGWWDGEQDYHDINTEIAKSFLGDEPIDLIGHSFGGTVALRLALECPEKVRSLVLIEPVLFAIARQDDPAYVKEHEREMNAIAAALQRGDAEEGARLFLSIWGGGPGWDALPAEARALMSKQIHIITASESAIYDDHAGLTDKARLAALECPVLLLRGGLSPRGIGTVNDGLAKRIGTSHNRVVEGAGHMLPITHPRDVAAEIRSFWGA